MSFLEKNCAAGRCKTWFYLFINCLSLTFELACLLLRFASRFGSRTGGPNGRKRRRTPWAQGPREEPTSVLKTKTKAALTKKVRFFICNISFWFSCLFCHFLFFFFLYSSLLGSFYFSKPQAQNNQS